MLVVNTNSASTIARSALASNARIQNQVMEALSTGKRINSASDDASGLAMSTRFTTQIKALSVAIGNAQSAISMLNTAEGALNEV